MSDKERPDPGRLPPPAFPRGSTRRKAASSSTFTPDEGEGDGKISADAIFSPDDKVVRVESIVPEDAFFSPDQPVVRQAPPTKPEDFEAVMKGLAADDDSDVVVTGMGLDSHMRGGGEKAIEDPQVERLYVSLRALTKGIRERGEAGLRTTPEMSRFEATLRGYCVGYLAGLRESPDAE